MKTLTDSEYERLYALHLMVWTLLWIAGFVAFLHGVWVIVALMVALLLVEGSIGHRASRL